MKINEIYTKVVKKVEGNWKFKHKIVMRNTLMKCLNVYDTGMYEHEIHRKDVKVSVFGGKKIMCV